MWSSRDLGPAGLNASAERIAALCEVLSDPRRVRALSLVGRGPATVSEISAALGLRPPSASLHLAKLRRLGLVHALKRGRHRIYSTDPDQTAHLLEVLGRTSLPPLALESNLEDG